MCHGFSQFFRFFVLFCIGKLATSSISVEPIQQHHLHIPLSGLSHGSAEWKPMMIIAIQNAVCYMVIILPRCSFQCWQLLCASYAGSFIVKSVATSSLTTVLK